MSKLQSQPGRLRRASQTENDWSEEFLRFVAREENLLTALRPIVCEPRRPWRADPEVRNHCQYQMKLNFGAERILAVVAHPDDAELLCAGTLARAKAEGAVVAICALCRGDKGQPAKPVANLGAVRRKEMAQAAGLLGARVFWGSFADGTLADSRPGRLKLIEFYRQFRRPWSWRIRWLITIGSSRGFAAGGSGDLVLRLTRTRRAPRLEASAGALVDGYGRDGRFIRFLHRYHTTRRAEAADAALPSKPVGVRE